MSRPAQISFTRLEEIAGGAHVVTDAAQIAAREVCGARPAAIVRPADAAQIAEILRFAAENKLAVIPTGGGTKLGIGAPPARYDIALDLSRMNRVLAYDPQDLTLGVEPGVRIEDLLRTLTEKKQFLPLAVPFSDRATIGGIVAANSSSPLRHAYGAVRDFCLGMEFVTGAGAQAKSGGRVVKNVTGYDLHKLLIGARFPCLRRRACSPRLFPRPRLLLISVALLPIPSLRRRWWKSPIRASRGCYFPVRLPFAWNRKRGAYCSQPRDSPPSSSGTRANWDAWRARRPPRSSFR
jgi:hypothetical protein